MDTNESGEERGFTDLAMDAGMEEEMNKCRYIRRLDSSVVVNVSGGNPCGNFGDPLELGQPGL